MKLKSTTTLNNDERGLIAIFTTIIIMFVLTLIIVGFSQVATRETKDVSNEQFSLQAFYASESGINDAYNTIASILNSNGGNGAANIPTDQTASCTGSFSSNTSNILGKNTSYPCLIVNPQPTVLTYNISSGGGQVIPIQTSVAGQSIQNITIQWQSPNSSTPCNYAAWGTNPEAKNWPSCSPPPLEVSILPVNFSQPGGENQADFARNVRNLFIYPGRAYVGGHGQQPANCVWFADGCLVWSVIQTDSNRRWPASCTSVCTANINMYGSTSSEYYMRILEVPGYGSATVSTCANATPMNPSTNVGIIGGCPNASGTQIHLVGAEAIIDSTGESVNVLKRLQVSVPINPASVSGSNAVSSPDYAIQSGSSICKRTLYGNGVGGASSNIYENLGSSPIPGDLGSVTVDGSGISSSPLTDSCSATY